MQGIEAKSRRPTEPRPVPKAKRRGGQVCAALIRYGEEGVLEIDNNGAERSRRGVAVGRKNWMFYGSANGGQTAAVLTSLIATCKRLSLDPFAYLRDLFGRISSHPPSRLAELLPDQWKTARQPAPTS